jgi:hypothetical protein
MAQFKISSILLKNDRCQPDTSRYNARLEHGWDVGVSRRRIRGRKPHYQGIFKNTLSGPYNGESRPSGVSRQARMT